MPQLQYIAYVMCERGVQQLREDEVIEILDAMRGEFTNLRAIQKHSSEDFLRLLERRTGILIEAGYVRHLGREVPVLEFRHLTFQEYLAGLALVDGKFPGKSRKKNLAEYVAPLAGVTKETKFNESDHTEQVVAENWREALRLCVATCGDDDIDQVLKAIHCPLPHEDTTTTARSRTVLAAFCLVDEPNVSEEIADEILQDLVHFVDDRDGKGIRESGIDVAVYQLSTSPWAQKLQSLLVAEFLHRTADGRENVGALAGDVGTSAMPIDKSQLFEWYEQRNLDIQSDNPITVVSSILSVTHAAYQNRSVTSTGIANTLISKLHGDDAIAHAAAWALRWLAFVKPSNLAWRPTPQQLNIFISLISASHTGERTASKLIIILGKAKYVPAVDLLISKLQSSNPIVTQAAVAALGEINDPRAVKPLISILNEDNLVTRRAALHALANIRDASSVEPVSTILKTEAELAWSASSALAVIGNDAASTELIEATHNESTITRAAAAWALGLMKKASGVAPLTKLLKDTEAIVRREAVEALGEIEEYSSIEAILEMLEDDAPDVRRMTANVLLKFNDPRLSLPLLSALRDPEPTVLEAVHNSLYKHALDTFNGGNIDGTITIFEQSLSVRQDDQIKNNMAFCYMLQKRFNKAHEQFQSMKFSKSDPSWPLYQHNRALLAYIEGNKEQAQQQMQESLRWIKDAAKSANTASPPDCMLLLTKDRGLIYKNELPIEAGCIINMAVITSTSAEDVSIILANKFAELNEVWAELLPEVFDS